MAKEFSRTQRIGELITRQLAKLIQVELRDPRVGMVCISAVDVTRDLRQARVFVTVLGDELVIKTTMEALVKARHFLRKELAQQLSLRVVPELSFVYDESVERGYQIAKLIDNAAAREK